ncbi:uncharacterized protein LOC130648733 [Hydractinia symbiolongicarpus]|uniref:uncharacterized protein LOC130648733 n=1 Tax=Hydractinia symbiolongicarpus TaxID=13093 RepID=UPI00254C37F0|nr:uncharacterized protein LOC130648733 [Hydractinia symbiolongicarpus]
MGKKNKVSKTTEKEKIPTNSELDVKKKRKRKKKLHKKETETSDSSKDIQESISNMNVDAQSNDNNKKRKTYEDVEIVSRKKKKKEKSEELSITYDLDELFSLNGKRPQGSHLNMIDIRTLIMLTVHGGEFPCLPTWCSFNAWQKVLKTVVILAGYISEDDYQQNKSCFNFLNTNFGKPLPVWNDGSSSMIRSPLECMLRYRMPKKLQQKKKSQFNLEKPSSMTTFQDFILSPSQLSANDFPDWNSAAKEHGVVSTRRRDERTAPTETSKLLAIDCEMCNTSRDNRALTRISVVDRDLNTVYDKLVKPDHPITDYLTQFSGITAEMLENVTTRLEDVQKDLLEIIPPDAILVGHSLDFDLRSLKLHHDNIIDTAVLYPDQRGPRFKSSLRYLMKTYLNRHIQNSVDGHCSIEDAKSCMELVLLKLKKGANFGNPELESESVYEALTRVGKRGALVDSSYIIRQHCDGDHHGLPCETDEEAVLKSTRIMNHADFIFTHLKSYEQFLKGQDNPSEETKQVMLKQIDKSIQQIVSVVPSSCLIVVSLSSGFIPPSIVALAKDKEKRNSTIVQNAVKKAKKGLCFVKVTT